MDQFVTKLNSSKHLPDKAYRRNTEIYELVCYVNCLVGCRASGNKDGESLFKTRAEEFVRKISPEPGFEQYFKLVKEYLRLD